MRFFRAGMATAGVVWVLVVIAALFWTFAPSPNFLGLPTGAAADVAGHSPGTLGKGRYTALMEATRRYKERGIDVSRGVADGSQLAPVPYLNRQLQRQGLKWRVRSTEGLAAEIYEIS
jgi:hypothetical protein